MSQIVDRILSGDTVIAHTPILGSSGALQALRTEMTGFVLRASHFWGLSDVMVRPDPGGATQPIAFLYSDCVPGLAPLLFADPEEPAGTETVFRMERTAPVPRFTATADYELIWSSSGGQDPAVLNDAIASARSMKVALCLGGDLWLVQKCVLPQYMREERYFRVSTPDRQFPFFTTWQRSQFDELIANAETGAEVRSTAFQGGVVAFSDGRFIWFNSPSSGAYQNYQEMRVFASAARLPPVAA
jgi:hypothetical protein